MKIACAQLDVDFGKPQSNLDRAVSVLGNCKASGADLIVFPECFLTGYCVNSREDAEQIALNSPGSCESLLEQLLEECKNLGVYCVVGFAEHQQNALYNSAALIDPNGKFDIYRKTHLPHLGFDRFVTPGDRLEVFENDLGKFGILICFDLRHPEASRVLALKGAELIILPTNWPVGAHAGPNFAAPARAAENRVFVATCNRVGQENGFDFIGQSGIYDVTGQTLAKAGTDQEIIYADIDLAQARIKRTVIRPDEYEIAMFESRRPELYAIISGSSHT